MKIAILSNFREFNPGYSLSGIVLDQCRMLQAHGHEVDCFVADSFKDGGNPYPDVLHLKKVIPHPPLTDYREKSKISPEHRKMVKDVSEVLLSEMPNYDFVITHDWVFTGWNMPYALAIQETSREIRMRKQNIRWGHWIHSVPSALQDWWLIREYGPGHKIVYPNSVDRIRVAENFRGTVNDVKVIPHIKDLRSFWEFDSETCRFIDDHPGIMNADVVQVYPASTDRLEAKQLEYVLLITAALKRHGFSVFLCIANQHYRGKKPKETVEKYMKIGMRNNLKYGEEFVFTAQWDPQRYGLGVPRGMLRELMLMQNLFIFPTREESFGLVAPEVALTAGGCLIVFNKSLQMMMEVSGMTGLYIDFGSYHMQLDVQKGTDKKYLEDIAWLILGRMRANEAINQKTFYRQNNNWDSIYKNYYGPILRESYVW
jgi:hypothetical protein